VRYSPRMRLTTHEVDSIKTAVRASLPEAKVFLFGSRTDDSKRGGDIDLLILNSTEVERKVVRRIKVDLIMSIGDQKIDIVAEANIEDPFVQFVLPDAIELI